MMRIVFRVLCTVLALTLVVVSPSFAQSSQGGKSSKGTGVFSPSSEPVTPQASEWGLTGLWKVISAETPPAKSFGGTGWYDRINRNPGQQTISTAGWGGFVSITDRIELGVQVNISRRIMARRIDQLGFGQATLFNEGKQGCPGCPLLGPPVPMPGQLIPRLRDPRTNVLTGRTGFYNPLPWVNRLSQGGIGELVLSGKFNLYSEARGSGASFAFRPWVSIPTANRDASEMLSRGSQLGAFATGFDLLLSKNAGDVAGLNFNAGYGFFANPGHEGQTLVGPRNVIPLGFGINVPRTSRFQVLGELTAEAFVGGGTPNSTFGAASPIDGTIGFRAYPWPWLHFSAGYRHNLNQDGGDKNGFVVTLGATRVPVKAVPPPPAPPTVSCSADQTRVYPGTVVRLTATASTATGRTLNYAWSASGGRIEGSGPEVRFDTTGLRPGAYTSTVRVDDGAGGFADCTVTVNVVEPPKPNPPTASCSVDRSSVTAGEVVTFRVSAASPDNRPLQYQWSVTRGARLQGSGTQVTLDTTNLSPGTYTASARVSDDRGLTADCSSSVTVSAPPPKPVMSKLNECKFKPNVARVDNVCKAVLDDVALRLQSDAEASSVLVGYSMPKERLAAKLAAQRASNVKEYLVKEKGLAAGRVEVRAVSGGEAQVEVFLVPRGATYTGPGETVKEQPTAQPYGRGRGAARRPRAAKPAATAENPAAAAEKPAAKPKAKTAETTPKK